MKLHLGILLLTRFGRQYETFTQLRITKKGSAKLTQADHRNLPPDLKRPTPFFKRTHPEIPIMISGHQMPTQIEQIGDSGMGTQESLGLPN